MSKTEINDYLSKYDEDLANNVIYRVYGMPGPIFMEKNNDTPTPEPPTPPTPGPDYSIPFYVENITQETETLTIEAYSEDESTYNEIPVEYSTDGTNWSSLGTTGATPLTRTLQPSDKVYLRATTNTWCMYYEVEDVISSCYISGVSKVGGNIMSLLYGSSFTGNETTFPSESSQNFSQLFVNSDDNIYIVDASNLLLPATTLSEGCYGGMFWNCTSLTSVPELPATTLAEGCYGQMFSGCTSLTTAPALPATTLAEGCYQGMFMSCESLTTAPTLPATTLDPGCYQNMFNGCTNLNRIQCLATDISASNCTAGWVSGVAATGTFVKNPNMSDWTTGEDGIPEGWTVEDATN